MASLDDLAGVDMNDMANLNLYSQILLFKNDTSNQETLFTHQSSSEQRILQSIAHSLSLEYEYSVANRTVRISRPIAPGASIVSTQEDLGSWCSPIPQFNYMNGFARLMGPNFPAFDHVGFDAENLDYFMNAPTTDLPIPSSFDQLITSSNFDGYLREISTMNHDGSMDGLETSSDSIDSGCQQSQEAVAAGPLNEHSSYESASLKRKQSGRSGSSAEADVHKIRRMCACHKCQKSFSSRQALEAHLLTHTENKSFECPECKKGFIRLDLLRRHQRVEGLCKPAKAGPKHQFSFRSGNVPDSLRDFSTPSLHKRGSVRNDSTAGYQEIVFESSSVHSGDQASAPPTPSGRKGPLSEVARAGMRAVKKIGSCWRCKFLRKTCDPEDPCLLCPKGDRSRWEAVGCQRGDFKSSMPQIGLCPGSLKPWAEVIADRPFAGSPSEFANALLKTWSKSRDLWLQQGGHDEEDPNAQYKSSEIRQTVVKNLANASFSLIKQPDTAALNPLQDCILAITWELLKSDSPILILEDKKLPDSILPLLCSAAVYQAKLESDQLIAQSLICLRSCLEAIRAKRFGALPEGCHDLCDNSLCKVDCISSLSMHLDLYLEELSRVFFKKENLRNRIPWWLSTFYSFCIQGIVRKVLVDLTKDCTTAFSCSPSGPEQFLYLPLRLFIATSGSYDPLTFENLQDGDASPDAEDYREARNAVKQADWKSQGIVGAGHYLKRLFDDEDGTILAAGSTQTSQPVYDDVNHNLWLSTGQLTPTSTMRAYQDTSSISSLGSAGPGSSYAIKTPKLQRALRSFDDTFHNQQVRRGGKACERCRMKKMKCDGESPCKRCKDDGLICTAGSRKKAEFKQLPRGYAEILENTQRTLIATVQKLYAMVRNGESWDLGEPMIDDRGQPVVHDIASKLGCIRPSPDGPDNSLEFVEDLAKLQARLQGAQTEADVEIFTRSS